MMKVLVIEDDPIEQIKLEGIFKDIGYLDVTCVSNLREATNFLTSRRSDIIVADIFLQNETTEGFIQELATPTVFITASKDMTVYERIPDKHKYAYLVKPVEPVSLYAAINMLLNSSVIANNDTDRKRSLLIKQGEKVHIVPLDDIYYCMSDGNYTLIHTVKHKYATRRPLRETMLELGADFVQTHRQYIVNVNHINLLKASSVLMNGMEVPLSKKYKKQLKSSLA